MGALNCFRAIFGLLREGLYGLLELAKRLMMKPKPPIDAHLPWALRTQFSGSAPGNGVANYPVAVKFRSKASATAAAKAGTLAFPAGYPQDSEYVSVWVENRHDLVAIWNSSLVERAALALPRFAPGAFQPRNTSVYIGPKLENSVMVVIDDGCAFAHEQFRFLDPVAGLWKTRVQFLWDQNEVSNRGGFPTDFPYGKEIIGSDIDAWLAACTSSTTGVDEDAVYLAADYQFAQPLSTHGTHVLDIAAGKVNPLSAAYAPGGAQDMAGKADIIFIQLPRRTVADSSGASMCVYVIDAIQYALNRVEKSANLVINLSYGAFAGPHDGSSITESAIDYLLDQRKHNAALVIPAGNAFNAACHARCQIKQNAPGKLVWRLMPNDPTDTVMECWYKKPKGGALSVRVKPPGYLWTKPVKLNKEDELKLGSDLVFSVIHFDRTSNGDDQLIVLSFGPTMPVNQKKAACPSGVWELEIISTSPNNAVMDAWIERDEPIFQGSWPGRQAAFLPNWPLENDQHDYPPPESLSKQNTLAGLATGASPIVVGACVQSTLQPSNYASAAGAKRDGSSGRTPDIAAFGDESEELAGILAAGTRSGYHVRMNGSSVAAPQVARILLNALAQARPAPSSPDLSIAEVRNLLFTVVSIVQPPPAPPHVDQGLRLGKGIVAP